MKIIGQILLALASIAYPLIWYYGREHGAFAYLALMMCALWLIRACLQKHTAQRIISLILAIFFAFALILQQPNSMYWYPVAVNLLMLTAFAGSLFSQQSLVERLARLQHPDLPAEGVRYTRKVTQIWCVFFIINATIAAALAISGKHDWWAVYTGIIAYILMGTLMGGEFLYRKLVLKI